MAKSMKSQLLLLIIPFLLVMLPYFANIFELKNIFLFNKITTQAFPIFFSYVSICSPHFSTFPHVFPHIFPIESRPGARAAPAAGAHRVATSRTGGWSQWTGNGGAQREDGAAWFGQWWDLNGTTCE